MEIGMQMIVYYVHTAPKKRRSKKSSPFVQSCGQEMGDPLGLNSQQPPQSVGSPTDETDSGFGPADDVTCSVTFQGTGGGYLTVGKTGNLGISQVSRSNSSSSQTDGASQAQPCKLVAHTDSVLYFVLLLYR